jgi:iron complex transport system substrate-binding protein
MVRRAGCVELLGTTGQVSSRLTREEAENTEHVRVVIGPCGYSMREAEAEARTMRARAPWAWLREKPVGVVDANRLPSSPGPGVVRGIEGLARVLHPGLFGHPSTRDAILVES